MFAKKLQWDRALDSATHRLTSVINRLSHKEGPGHPSLISDIRYAQDGSRTHLTDIWVPVNTIEPMPVVLYIHGGGFVTGSKDTHQLAGRVFSSRGYLTFVINYRLKPRYPYPASIEDCCKALCWIWDKLEKYGGDKNKIIFAGESAGGNLAAVLTMITAYKRPETWCKEVWQRNIRPMATIPFCGWHEPLAFDHHPTLQIAASVEKLSRAVFGHELVDTPGNAPLLSAITASEGLPDRPVPPFLITVGTWDPIKADSLLLKNHLESKNIPVTYRAYRKGFHAHHLIRFSPGNRKVWKDVDAFLEKILNEHEG